MSSSQQLQFLTYQLGEAADACITGWLRKQGGPMRTMWQRRWCVLGEGKLAYYQREDEARLLGTIPLQGNDVDEKSEESGKFIFEIHAPVGQKISANHEVTHYLLSADSELDRTRWIHALKWWAYATRGGAVFARRLDVVMSLDSIRRYRVPRVVVELTQQLEERGRLEEGVFRRSGSVKVIRELREMLDRGDHLPKPFLDIHSMAGLLKSFFRELPEPLVPFESFNFFCTCGERVRLADSEERRAEELAAVRKQLEGLPVNNSDLLSHLCGFLHRLTQCSDVTKMDSTNLALVFATNIIRDPDHADFANAEITYSQSQISVSTVELFIKEFETLFPAAGDILLSPDSHEVGFTNMEAMRRELAWSSDNLLDDAEGSEPGEHTSSDHNSTIEYSVNQCTELQRELYTVRENHEKDLQSMKSYYERLLAEKDAEIERLRGTPVATADLLDIDPCDFADDFAPRRPAPAPPLSPERISPTEESTVSMAPQRSPPARPPQPRIARRQPPPPPPPHESKPELNATIYPRLSTLEEWE